MFIDNKKKTRFY